MNARSRKTALVVDDDFGFRESTAFLLRRLGYAVHATDDPSAALARICSHQTPDVVVCAAGMQPMTGMDLLRAVRADETYRSLPFIISTFDGSDEFWAECLRSGATDHVVKPFTLARLSDALDLNGSATRLRARLLQQLYDAL